MSFGSASRPSLVDLVERRFPEVWPTVPAYEGPDRGAALRCLESIDVVLREAGGAADHSAAFEETVCFVEGAFALYEGRATPARPADRVFVVPSRLTRDDPSHGPEAAEIFPLLSSGYGVGTSMAQRVLALLPPAILSSYEAHQGRQGHVMLVPVTGDMVADLGPERAADRAAEIVGDAARFARDRLGADVIGLGATLPSLTRFGRSVAVDGLVTTTGHGGTVYLIQSLARHVARSCLREDERLRMGVVGAAGSIGASALTALLTEFPEAEFVVCDRPGRLARAERVLDAAGATARATLTSDVGEVLRRCPLIVSAITERLDLDEVAPGLDLHGRVLIDDSQPGCFDRDQLEKRGGLLLWPIGSAATGTGPLHRQNGYRYGSGVGLLHADDLWGCEAEAAAIALTGDHEAALQSPVTPEAVQRIGALCASVGIRAAEPQSYATPVPLPAPGADACGALSWGAPAGRARVGG